ncbi:GntR family transcriptional regulator [Bradyrhizobium diazoefficiens]|uniref:GntR family transcriptional regulator n=1 Tax=Bradyrhizobium diazoefficiens TaxID=1355477 RepID=UPI00190C846A|nr:GntR family transcriptional regulator [Bradyrhizobium diazoefficiens]
MKARIDDGVYRPRDQLPSTRAFAAEFGASRTTITAAYEQLLAEGFIETRRDAGPLFRLRFDRGACHGPAASRRQERLVYRRSGDGSSSCPDRRSRPKPCRFRCGDIAAADFQSLAWRRALTKVLRTPGPRSLRYQAPRLASALRQR